ncbi:TadE family protein [Roseiarcus sp.]|uniref:TadE family protein n=1 Tax=Roseiarcus sp. TaxID=1969460 RepID=UPI003F9CA524
MRSCERSAAAVEFALTVPLFITLLLGANQRLRRAIMDENGGGAGRFVGASRRAIVLRLTTLRWLATPISSPARAALRRHSLSPSGTGSTHGSVSNVPAASRSPSDGRRR